MLLWNSQIIGSDVIEDTEGRKITKVSALIVQPETGRVLGIQCGNNVISSTDIRKWQPEVHIHDTDSIIEPDEVQTIKYVVNQKFFLIGLPVKTKKGHLVGKTADFIFDDQTNELEKILISRYFYFIPLDKRLISRSEIIEITSKAIIIKDEHAFQKFKLKNPLKYPKRMPSGEAI